MQFSCCEYQKHKKHSLCETENLIQLFNIPQCSSSHCVQQQVCSNVLFDPSPHKLIEYKNLYA